MSDFMKKYFKWVLLGFFVFVFAFVIFALLNDKLSSFDNYFYYLIISLKSPFFTSFFKAITFCASPLMLIIVSIFLFIVFKNKKYGLLSLANLIFIVVVNQGLKLLFSRDRPFNWMLIDEKGFSFPSGHVMVSSAFYGIVIYLLWRTNITKRMKILFTFFLCTLVFLIGISRIYLGVHYASDVIAGFAFSLSYLIISTALIDYYLSKRKKSSK